MKPVHKILGSILLAISGQSVMAAPPIVHFPPVFLAPREIPCSEFLKPYLNWASGATPAYEDVRTVGITSVYNQQKNPVQDGIDSKPSVVGYSVGALRYVGGNLQGDVTSYFNDRTFCMNNGGGGLCLATNPFSPNATDIANITLGSDGSMTTVLKTWGNSTYHDSPVCMSNGLMYIPSKAGQSAMSVITLQKSGYRNPR